MTITVCGPASKSLKRRYWRCPMCQCITETVVSYELWYGQGVWCCRCGDAWQDGNLCARGFYRYWRRDAQRHAQRLWDRATFGPDPTPHDLDPDRFPEVTS